jgi:hypothetical protein
VHITFYKPGRIPIPPKLYGGAQRAIYWLGKGLLEFGHRVTLIANAQSHIPGAELRAIDADETDPRRWLRLIPDSTDIIQLFNEPSLIPPKPFLVRMGGNGRPGQRFHPNTIFLSKNHAATYGSRHFVHNGLDPGEYVFFRKTRGLCDFFGQGTLESKKFARRGSSGAPCRSGIARVGFA